LVSSAGIPMPQPAITSPESSAVDPTKGLNKEEPKPKEPEPKKDAIDIHKFEKEKPLPASRPSKVFESKTPQAENAVPYGKGGQTDLPSGFSDFPGPANGGVAVQGPGGADFASRYGWYIEAVKRALHQKYSHLRIQRQSFHGRFRPAGPPQHRSLPPSPLRLFRPLRRCNLRFRPRPVQVIPHL